MNAKIYLLLLLAIPGMTIGQREQGYCNSITIHCVCGIGETKKFVPLELKISAVNDSETGMVKCSGYPDPYQACANISCFLAQNNSKSNVNVEGFISNFYPKEFIVRRGINESHRFARDSSECHIPALKNAEARCWQYPNSVTCELSCIYGYGLPTSTETLTSSTLNCQISENVWTPYHGFYDCRPYLNCNVQLENPGTVKCVEPLDGPAYCDISCADYAQYEGVPLQRYQCADESFENNLPYCASLRKNVRLIQKPY